MTLQISFACGGNSRLYSEPATTRELWTIEHETCKDLPSDSDRNSVILDSSVFQLQASIVRR